MGWADALKDLLGPLSDAGTDIGDWLDSLNAEQKKLGSKESDLGGAILNLIKHPRLLNPLRGAGSEADTSATDQETKKVTGTLAKPKLAPSAVQDMQAMTKPYAESLENIGQSVGPIEQQAATATPSPSGAEATVSAIAQSMSGEPVTESPLTQAESSEYAGITAPYMSEINQIQDTTDTNMASAAAESQKSYPYETTIQDLLGRYAYTLESPYLTPTAPQSKTSPLPSWLAQLITVASAVGDTTPVASTGTLPSTSTSTSAGASGLNTETAQQIAASIDPSEPAIGGGSAGSSSASS